MRECTLITEKRLRELVEIESKVQELIEALEKMVGPTFGTESCNTDGENWSIVQEHLNSYQRCVREALRKVRGE